MKVSFPVTVRELVHAHRGRPAVVMGGGPSLPDGVAKCPADAVYLSANEHGARFLAEHYPDRRCSYIVALDAIRDRLKPWGVPIIGRYFWADYRVLRFRLPDSGQESAMCAAWVARLAGCAPIIITGVDCYSGGAYWHDQKAESNGFVSTPKQHLQRWRWFVQHFPAMYRVLGGALYPIAVEQLYDPAERPLLGNPSREELEREASGELCKVDADRLVIRMQEFERGQVVELHPIEARELAEKKKVRRLGPAPITRRTLTA